MATTRDQALHRSPQTKRSAASLLRDDLLMGQPLPTPQKRWGGLPCLADRYVVHDAIARGPVFQVYRAWDIRMEREVALKMLARQIADDDADWTRACHRFSQEALAMMMVHPFGIQHPEAAPAPSHVVKCYGLIRTPRAHYIAMEYLEGVNLRHWLELHQPDRQQLQAIVYGIGNGLQELHAVGLLHRDIKPENVMITSTGRVVLIDLGIAHRIERGYAPDETELVRGTPGYLAPEQLLCKQLSPATDIYALGAVMYEMMTGQCLFSGTNTQQLLMSQMTHRIPSMTEHAKDPQWAPLVPVLKRCLKRSAAARFGSFASLWDALTGRP